MLQVELLGGFFLPTQQVADSVPAHHVADFFGGIFNVIGGPLDGVSHGDDVHAVWAPEG